MTFPSRAALTRIRGETFAQTADLELIWRETCSEFLYACFNGAPSGRIAELGNEVMIARDNLLVMTRGYR